ncbi:MAG: PspC domain-containing protein [Bacteroidetes Order II. Incertae sedis bacterium]|nr:PspC domain-containing protein [Bacteroidetes Order II. bacterium]MBT4053387.1 PspC domain-containing protein [Bacteroidetes Order II. bacterium]MBT4603422.1 PspC domain-containing protein [Bacteroidetes Order II. bacterium]MBT5249682.1 PspC domain-containing protein [Bacteroidetes Order II. bacterium]MBT6200234.1 PspC domain-containing protein [Bacteroidetes Order II. bacterium]
MSTRKLKRNSHDKMIAGVCGGIANFFGIDSTLVRVGYVLLSVFSAIFPSIVVYLILAFVMPED